MALLTPIDEKALRQVDIAIFPDKLVSGDRDIGEERNGYYRLNSENLQFPPLIKKDTKSANWEEHQSASFEPYKVYKYANSREISLKFQWVIGGIFTPTRVHDIISNIKAYFYHINAGQVNGDSVTFPVVEIRRLYGLITRRTTWRMMNMDVQYSEEMVQEDNVRVGDPPVDAPFYPLHVELTMNLESATRLSKSHDEQDSPFDVKSLETRPRLSWY